MPRRPLTGTVEPAVGIAFFDLDKTLFAANSGSLWIRRELELGHISKFQAFLATGWILKYHLGFAQLETALERALKMLTGIPEAALRDRTKHFYEHACRSLYRPGALQALREHRAKGDRCVLLTSSSGYMADLVAHELKLDHVLCNRFEVDEGGLHTGRAQGSICFGQGKLSHATQYAEAVGERLSDATFYTDSYSDISVMLAVGTPVAVNPDHRLRREALRRGWRVVDWGTPELSQPTGDAHPA